MTIEQQPAFVNMRSVFTKLAGRHLRGVLLRDETFDPQQLDGIADDFVLSLYGDELEAAANVGRIRGFFEATAQESIGSRMPGYESFCSWFLTSANKTWDNSNDLIFGISATTEDYIYRQELLLAELIDGIPREWLKSAVLRYDRHSLSFFQLWLTVLRVLAIVKHDLYILYDDVECSADDAAWLTRVFDWYDRSLNHNQLLLNL